MYKQKFEFHFPEDKTTYLSVQVSNADDRISVRNLAKNFSEHWLKYVHKSELLSFLFQDKEISVSILGPNSVLLDC